MKLPPKVGFLCLFYSSTHIHLVCRKSIVLNPNIPPPYDLFHVERNLSFSGIVVWHWSMDNSKKSLWMTFLVTSPLKYYWLVSFKFSAKVCKWCLIKNGTKIFSLWKWTRRFIDTYSETYTRTEFEEISNNTSSEKLPKLWELQVYEFSVDARKVKLRSIQNVSNCIYLSNVMAL